ncbi:uncharacterized protein LOC119068925 [Bradysia coprophila]|uniref:uncharacterized protein LOC119068925 n=1 Tax=Bradysia coprophila TaxID=38358 RepID=UPI00187D74BE|nr:uncharacterized protein LOC119068925 [Bradysia coprophila]
MKSISEIKNNRNTACNVASLQSIRTETVPADVRDSDLLIDLRSEKESCGDENSETDINKKSFPYEYDFERDIEKLIQVSKQFQTDYEKEKTKIDAVSEDNYLRISILNSNSQRKQKPSASEIVLPVNDRDNFYFSSRSLKKENILDSYLNHPKQTFTPTVPHPGPFGTGVIRPSPKKHSCVSKGKTLSTKRFRSSGWSVKPYTSRYYNFDRTHPDLKLVESGVSMIPKRISKEATELTTRAQLETTTKPLLSKGLTWHQFFERCNVYSSKSFQSTHGDTTATQPAVSELLTPTSNDNSKIQKHILPQLNIRAECCVQRIPEISIAPCGFKRTVNTNIKLVEIIYEESDSTVETDERRSEETLKKVEEKVSEPFNLQSNSERASSVNLELPSIDESTEDTETKTSSTSSSQTPSKNNGYDSSLEESISLNVSRASALTSGFADHEMKARSLKDVGIQTTRLVKIASPSKETANGKTISSSSDPSKQEYVEYFHQPPEVCQEIKLPTFPTHELVQMVDEIFDTSSDAVNMSYKYIVKETSVQTDIVWENINDLFKQQNRPTLTRPTDAVETKVSEFYVHPNANFVNQLETGEQVSTNIASESNKFDNLQLLQVVRPVERFCRHSRLKKIKICSCLGCKSNIRFSSVNIDQSIQRTSNDSSSSSVFDSRPIPSARVNLFPSERYKRMKQAQREHFENDPRISRTLRKIYATARANKTQETTSSSSSGCYGQSNVLPRQFSTYDDKVLEPDLFTFNDELLLFGFETHDEIEYSSRLLKTESSQDSSISIGKYYTADANNQQLRGKSLFCTNSEEVSSCNSVCVQRVSELEQCLLKDIENSGSDPSALSSLLSASSLERKINEIRLVDIS